MAELSELEHSLWETATRYDFSKMEAILASDMLEFGRSGRRYSRAELMPEPDQQQTINARLHDLECRTITHNVALVTYVCELDRNGEREWSNRASLWSRTSEHWQLRFHQGAQAEALK
ncbi:MAG: DUF4440 domain-containing protein [Pseudomonadota bacterium]